MKKWFDSPLFLNVSIGLLGVLLLILVTALFARVVYPRIVPERSDIETHLISNVIQLEVLNGCGVPGVATRFTNHLRSVGFDVVQSGNFETFDLEHTIVIDRSGNKENARRVARAIGVSEDNIIRETSPFFYLDATVVVGADFDSLEL